MGTAGAGLASSIACVVGVILSAYYFHAHEKYVAIHREQMRVLWSVWSRLFIIGLPVGLEFMLMSLVMAIIYWLIRDFGSSAQQASASRRVSCASSCCPRWRWPSPPRAIAGQNFGGACARDLQMDRTVQRGHHVDADGGVPVRVAVFHAHLHK